MPFYSCDNRFNYIFFGADSNWLVSIGSDPRSSDDFRIVSKSPFFETASGSCPPVFTEWSNGLFLSCGDYKTAQVSQIRKRCWFYGPFVIDNTTEYIFINAIIFAHLQRHTDGHKCDWNCHVNAYCLQINDEFTCKCEEGFIGDGIECVEVNIINECALEIDNCSDNAYCVDYIFGYECVCYNGFTDLQPNSPGQICAREQPCCKTFKFHLYHLSFVTAICTIQ